MLVQMVYYLSKMFFKTPLQLLSVFYASCLLNDYPEIVEGLFMTLHDSLTKAPVRSECS